MGKAIRNYLILLSAVVIVMALTVFSSADRKVDWEQTYDANSKQQIGRASCRERVCQYV